MYLEGRWRQ